MKVAQQLMKLKLLLKDEAAKYSEDELLLQLELAAEAINNRRGFVATEDVELEDKFKMLLIQLTATAINKTGAEGEVSHSENGVARSYGSDSIYPLALMNSIAPLVGLKGGNK